MPLKRRKVKALERNCAESICTAFGPSTSSLIGLPNSFEMQHILMNALADKDVQKKNE